MFVVLIRCATMIMGMMILFGVIPYITFSAMMSVFLFAMMWAYVMRHVHFSILWVFLFGLCVDVITQSPLGLHALICVVLGYVFAQSALWFTYRGEYKIIWGTVIAFVVALVAYVVYAFFVTPRLIGSIVLLDFFVALLTQMIVFGFFAWILRGIERYVARYTYKVNVKRHA